MERFLPIEISQNAASKHKSVEEDGASGLRLELDVMLHNVKREEQTEAVDVAVRRSGRIYRGKMNRVFYQHSHRESGG